MCGRGPLLAFVRETDEERLLCVFNAGNEVHGLELEEGRPSLLLGQAELRQEDGLYTALLPPRSGAVFSMK